MAIWVGGFDPAYGVGEGPVAGEAFVLNIAPEDVVGGGNAVEQEAIVLAFGVTAPCEAAICRAARRLNMCSEADAAPMDMANRVVVCSSSLVGVVSGWHSAWMRLATTTQQSGTRDKYRANILGSQCSASPPRSARRRRRSAARVSIQC